MQIVAAVHSGRLMAKLWVNWVFNIFKADLVACLCSSESCVAFLGLMTRSVGPIRLMCLNSL